MQDIVNPNQGLPEGAKNAFETEAKATIDQLRNYPSIITWVLFNENWGQYDQQRLTKWVKAMDTTRIVNGHSGELLYVNGALKQPSENPYVDADMTDVHSYPYPMLSVKQPGKAQVCGEFGGIGVSVIGHQWDDLTSWGYIQVSSKDFENKYAEMVRHLIELEKQGLSASIYTQPFDVEGEENGIMSYDREIIKIPLKNLRSIHSKLALNSSLPKDFFIGRNIDVNYTDESYPNLINEFKTSRVDSAFLRKLLLMSIRKKDSVEEGNISFAYINTLRNVYTFDNLDFIRKITLTSNGAGFKLFRNQTKKINLVLGQNAAEDKIMSIIYREEIAPFDTLENVDWDLIEKRVVEKYGELGQERVWGNRMAYYSIEENWPLFAKYYKLYFDRAISFGRSFIHINNLSWPVFEHIADPDVLETAIRTMKYNIDHFSGDDAAVIDTYANLLYKTGKKNEAINWQIKAVELDTNNKDIKSNLEKMRNAIPTWDPAKQVKK